MTRRIPLSTAPSVAGARIVSGATLEAKLGRTTMLVWRRLCARRDNVTGETHVSLGGLARAPWEQNAEELATENVRYALSKLCAAGLVSNEGRAWKRVACGVSRAPRRVFVRKVFGTELVIASDTEQFMVPETTAAWLEAATSWGGKRSGAGRPARAQVRENTQPTGVRVSLAKNQVPRSDAESSPPLRNQVPRSDEEIKSPARSDLRVTKVRFSTDLSLPSGEKEGRELAPIDTIFSSETQEPMSKTPEHPGPEHLEVATQEPTTTIGMGLGSLPPRKGVVLGLSGRLPPYPSSALVKPAVVPSAPKLNPDQSWEDWLLLMAKAYEGACASRWPLELRTKVRKTGAKKGQAYIQRPTGMLGHPRSEKWDGFREKLKEAADALLSLDLSPFAWASFSAQVWRGMNEHKNGERTGKVAKWPPVDWLWSPARILERGDSPAVHECTEGGAVVYGDTHKLLLSKYTDLQREVGFGVPVEEAMSKYLTLAEYESLLQQARVEAEEKQRELNRRARAGEWLW